MSILSLDLAGSPSRRTGYAFWKRDAKGKSYSKVGSVFSDEEILTLIEKFRPSVVGIDAPLSLPAGRSSIEEKGPHFREVDLQLKAMHIRFFPISLGPMRMLTKRGMELKKKIMELGKRLNMSISVYELFPGGSLDILNIPRKTPEAVNAFMKPFGLLAKNVDESDAAIGLFTLWQYVEGCGLLLKGREGEMLLASSALYLGEPIFLEFEKRINRFVVEAKRSEKQREDAQKNDVRVYLRDTGSLSQHLVPGAKLYAVQQPNGRKLKFMVKAIYNKELGQWVYVDPFYDAEMAREFLRTKGILTQLGCKKVGHSIFDLALVDVSKRSKGNSGRTKGCVEVKGASHFVPLDSVTSATSATVSKDCTKEIVNKTGNKKWKTLFPEPYSKRAERHFYELGKLAQKGMEAQIIFVAHFDAGEVGLNPAYPHLIGVLKGAMKKGVQIKALSPQIRSNYWCFKRKVPFRL